MKTYIPIIVAIICFTCSAVQGQDQENPQKYGNEANVIKNTKRETLYESEEFREQAERILKEEQFNELREKRRDILQRLLKVKAQIEKLDFKYSDLVGERDRLNEESKKLSSQSLDDEITKGKKLISRYESYLSKLQENLAKSKDESEKNQINKDIDELNKELRWSKSDVEKLENDKLRVETSIENAETRIKAIAQELLELEKEIKNKSLEYASLLEKQFLVEDRINV